MDIYHCERYFRWSFNKRRIAATVTVARLHTFGTFRFNRYEIDIQRTKQCVTHLRTHAHSCTYTHWYRNSARATTAHTHIPYMFTLNIYTLARIFARTHAYAHTETETETDRHIVSIEWKNNDIFFVLCSSGSRISVARKWCFRAMDL